MIERCASTLRPVRFVGAALLLPGVTIRPYQVCTALLLTSPWLMYLPVPKNSQSPLSVGFWATSMPPVMGCAVVPSGAIAVKMLVPALSGEGEAAVVQVLLLPVPVHVVVVVSRLNCHTCPVRSPA